MRSSGAEQTPGKQRLCTAASATACLPSHIQRSAHLEQASHCAGHVFAVRAELGHTHGSFEGEVVEQGAAAAVHHQRPPLVVDRQQDAAVGADCDGADLAAVLKGQRAAAGLSEVDLQAGGGSEGEANSEQAGGSGGTLAAAVGGGGRGASCGADAARACADGVVLVCPWALQRTCVTLFPTGVSSSLS